MKKVICLLFIAACLSCNQKENPTEVLFRNHLKETLELYKQLCLSSASRLEQREYERGYKRRGSDSLRLVQARFSVVFEKTKIKNQPGLLKLQSALYSKFNLLFPYYAKYEQKDADKLIYLKKEDLKLYIECDFYKTQYQNLEHQADSPIIWDGLNILNANQMKKIKALDNNYDKSVKEILKEKTNN